MGTRRERVKYSFSRDKEAVAVSFFISDELNDRLITLCNITELNKSSVCRYLLKRGVAEMEGKMLELADKNFAGGP